MKIVFCSIILITATIAASAQKNTKESLISDSTLIAEYAASACQCMDTIETYNRSKLEVASQVNKCIDQQVLAFQSVAKISSSLGSIEDLLNDGKKKGKRTEIVISVSPESEDYKKYYYKLERNLMDNCPVLKAKIAASDKLGEKSMSKNPIALLSYTHGVEAANDTLALAHYQKAVEADPNFVFAWDNLGITCRKLKLYDKAIMAYQNSLKIDPTNGIPLQNLAVVYKFVERYEDAIKTYEQLGKLQEGNPEVYYGIGQIYTAHLNDDEKAADNLCKAYNLYIEQKSPYRTDAESMLSVVYHKMKKAGKEQQFYKILKENKIAVNED